MDLDFTADQDALRANVADVLARESPRSLARAVAEGTGDADALWERMVELGWPALTVPEDAGGLGLGAVELAIVCEELGRALAPSPFLATVTQHAATLRELGAAEALGPVAVGARTGTLALAETDGDVDPVEVTATASPDEDHGGYTLTGTKRYVFDGDRADVVVVVARIPGSIGDEGVGAFLLLRDEIDVVPVANVDLTRPLATLVLDGIRVDASRVVGPPGPATARAVRRAVEESTMALALEGVGVCSALFDDTLEYAKQREQFGVPIGSFQAIKHKLTDMYLLLERARATGYFAALTLAEDDERRSIAVSTAKAAVGDASARLGKESIQIHGGIGYTWEHDTHLYVRHAIATNALFGTAADHRARVADRLGLRALR